MFLKKLESVGFKSFAERISVEFVPGVTAVVGPNGSGKSNIIDAVRWVLGEQSAKSLRGAKMEDIIFQGSDSRKALNVAEVTLVLDNTDQALPIEYEEVSITRRVYRSGDSEFLINKQSCRLKDIIELFMDSGLGREAFSIISQGKVEEILSSKAEERRTIFEEAAGVLKYKQRKKKAEYKLAETQENLNRIEDIIYEIEAQLDPLKQQAMIAKDYLSKKDELKQQEVSLLITEIEQLHEQWETLLKEIDHEKQQEIQVKTKIQSQEAYVETEKSKIQVIDEKVEELQQSLLLLTQELENLEGNKKLIHERLKHYTENKSKLEQEGQQLEEKTEKLDDDLQIERAQLEKYQEVRNTSKQHVQQINEKLSTTKENIQDQIEELKSEYIELLNSQAAKRNERQSIDKQLNQLGAKKNLQQDKFQDLIKQREWLTDELQTLEKELDQVQQKRNQLESEYENSRQLLTKHNQAYEQLQTKLYQGYQYIEKLKSKKEMLEEMKEDFQGFFFGVKEVLKAREEQQLSGINGAVLELMDVPSKYITAIETSLGGQAQNIVVKDESTARNAIDWLKRTNKGRATFLPLTTINSRYISSHLLSSVSNHSGYVGVASDLIRFDSKYQNVMTNLLGNVIIADNLKAANQIAASLQRRYRVVTVDGDIVNPGGSMTGGAMKKTTQSLFTREKDLQEINAKIADYQTKAADFEATVDAHKQKLKTQEEQLEMLRQAINEQQQQEQQSQAKVTEKKMKLSHLNENLTLYDQENSQFDNDVSSLQERDQNLTAQLNEIESSLAIIQEQIDTLSKQQFDYQQNHNELQEQYHKLQVTLAEQEAQVRNQTEKTDAIRTSLEETRQLYQTNQESLLELEELHQSNDKIEDLDTQLTTKKETKETTVEEIQSLRQQRLSLTQAIQDQERELKEQNRSHQGLVKAIQEKEVKANRLDVDLENRLHHLQDEYKISFEKAQQTYPKVDDIKEATIQVKQMKQAIEALGTVNIGAIDEYERIEERYLFLTGQQQDLIQAKDTLYGVIGEMDEEMKRRFEETFFQIKAEFSIVFQQLFGGGRAELKLTEPDNILDTGVDIIAQPPGKKLQHLGLLSGGERALTAIALLFAILRVRPVPFCILDEVEAALDEANVSRFAQYLKFYSEKTQFIVITHRKGTMEEADVLYGVTMQESGVSRLVSVRLEDTPSLVQT
ncbi:chromosome segregation protein SMC [Radiobacillus sp. PE A8.2]|uniref:chromosome segregation protein SMC n=1 Tax=Radiobacillus sp. PE A8.2 TaxID=3380349 RepID=UPI00388D3B82